MWRGSKTGPQGREHSQRTMAEIVNLRRARKAKARREKEAEADANRTKHGVAKSVRELSKARREKARHDVESHKLTDDK